MANPNQNARNSRGRYVRTRESAARDNRAAELHEQGWTYQQIADELGFASKSGSHGAVDRAIRSVTKDVGGRILERREKELQLLWETAMEILESPHVVVSNGRVMELNGQPLRDDAPMLQAVTEMRRINESLRKLHGTDQPNKVEHSGGVKYEVVGVNPEDLK